MTGALGRDRCYVCTRVLTQGEIEFLDSDIDFMEHHGHLIGRAYDAPEVPFMAGDRVEIIGGFEDGLHGVIVANEPKTAAELEELVPGAGVWGPRAYRWRVRIDGGDKTIGGLRPGSLIREGE